MKKFYASVFVVLLSGGALLTPLASAYRGGGGGGGYSLADKESYKRGLMNWHSEKLKEVDGQIEGLLGWTMTCRQLKDYFADRRNSGEVPLAYVHHLHQYGSTAVSLLTDKKSHCHEYDINSYRRRIPMKHSSRCYLYSCSTR